MYTNAKSVYAAQLAEIEAAGLWKHERHDHLAAGRAHHDERQGGHQLLREQLPRPVVAPARDRGGARRRSTSAATACRACASSAARRTSHKELEAAISQFLGTEDTILYSLVLRRERRPVRDAARRGGRDHLRRAQPRVDHRRRPPLQGRAPPLRARRPGRPRGEAQGDAGQAPAHDRDRRRVLDGRRHRARSTRSATSPRSTARW